LDDFPLHPRALAMQHVAQGLQFTDQPLDLLHRAARHTLQERADIVGDDFAVVLRLLAHRSEIAPDEFANFAQAPNGGVIDYHWANLFVGRLPDFVQIALGTSLTKIRTLRELTLAMAVPPASNGGGQVAKPEQHATMAAQCLRLARIVRDAESKAMLVKMAEAWVKLAERLKVEAEQESV
jgi:hypothetical protein